QFGNYGLSFLEDMIKCYQFLHNTPYQFKNEKIAILRNYVLEGQQWIAWNNKYDISAAGRQLFPKEMTQKFNILKASIEKLQELDKDFYKAYDIAKNTKLLEGNKHFYKSDFQVHRSKEFYFSVKMSSKRVIGTESVNKENVQGYFMGDGVSLLYTDKNQYNEIFPFWDWKKLPGTTIIQDDKPLPIIRFKEFKTNSNFVGGVSNGKNGIAVLDYDRDGLFAKKSWFMFDDKIVCIGTDINAKTNFPVATTLNQVFLKGDVIVSQKNKINTKFRGNKPVQLDWILHDDIGYLVNNNNKINVQSRFLEGSWNNVAKRYRPVILTETILKIWLDHGKNPNNKSYEYILIPNATSQKMKELHKQKPFEIINTKTQQSVVSSDKKTGGIIFYSAGKSKLLGGISVDKPCVLMFEKRENDIEVSISEPTQNLDEIKVSFDNYKIDDKSTSKHNISIQLQQGEKAGKTTTFYIKK
ncbi:MAG: polysaccharide lyase family 8 super-sandwich domain-containing protein, partial [Polaribacter sp.]